MINALHQVCPQVFCAQILQIDHEFLDTPINVYMHAMTMHEWQTIMTVLMMCIRQYVVYPCKFCTNVTHMRFFSSWSCEFLNWEMPAKANSGQFASRENTSLYFNSVSVFQQLGCKLASSLLGTL